MTLPLNPAMLEAAYEYLRATPPFSSWNLPDGEDVKFQVLRTRRIYADYYRHKGKHIIRLTGKCGHTATLLVSMAHEMIHLHHKHAGIPMPGDGHGTAFKKHAARVCKYHGFDPQCF